MKPKFDASKPYEIIEKPSFDPSKPYEVLEEKEDGVLSGLAKIGEKIDAYTGAPTRAAVMASIKGENPLKAAIDQFGDVAGPEISGRAIVENIPQEVSDLTTQVALPGVAGSIGQLLPKETKKDIAGVVADVVLDYTNLIPGKAFTTAVKAPISAIESGAKAGTKLLNVAPEVIQSGITKISPALGDVTKGIGQAVKSGADAVLGIVKTPTLADDAVEAIRTAKKYNIDPKVLGDSLVYGPEATITKMGKVLAQGPEGDIYRKQFENAVDAVSKATDEFLAKLSSKPDAQSPEAIGNLIRKATTENKARELAKFDVTNKFIIENVPGWKLNKDELAMINSKLVGTDRLRNTLIDMRSESNVAARNALSDAIQIFSSIGKNPSYKSLYEKLDDLGEYMGRNEFKNLENTKAKKQIKDLYKTVRDAMTESVGRIRPELKDELIKSNAAISEYLNSVDAVVGAVNKTDAGEDIFRKLVRGASSDEVRAMKKLLTPDELGQVKQGLIGQFVRVEPGLGEEVLYKTDVNKFMRWAESNKAVIDNLFSADEIKSLRELEKLRRRVGDVKFNTSNTDVSNAFRNLFDSIKKNSIVAGVYEAQKARGLGAIPEDVAKELGVEAIVRAPKKGATGAPEGAMGLNYTKGLLSEFKNLKSKGASKALSTMSATEKSSTYEPEKEAQERYEKEYK